MQVRKYQAASMNEALKLVRRDLGSQAIIVSTKTVGGMKNKGSFGKQPGVEIIAAIDYDFDSSFPETESFSQLVKDKFYPTGGLPSEGNSLEKVSCELSELKRIVKQYYNSSDGTRNGYAYGELKELKWMAQFFLRQATSLNRGHFPEHIGDLYYQMLKQDICEETVLKLVEELREDLSPDLLGDKDQVRKSLISKIEKDLLLAGPIDLTPGKNKIAAFVGPTGVGKTTTIAKLAANYALEKKKKVALVTIDTYRIAAVEQLKIYSNIIGIPLKSVSSPEELKQVLAEFADKDLILIDTAGRSQRDQSHIDEIKGFFEQPFPVEISLVMSITCKEHNLSAVSQQFGFLPIDSIIFTKLDESYTYGSIINQLFKIKKPLAYLTTGQKVPEDIEVATKERIISLVLNEAENHYC